MKQIYRVTSQAAPQERSVSTSMQKNRNNVQNKVADFGSENKAESKPLKSKNRFRDFK